MDDFYTSFLKKTTIMTGQEKKKWESLPFFRGVSGMAGILWLVVNRFHTRRGNPLWLPVFSGCPFCP